MLFISFILLVLFVVSVSTFYISIIFDIDCLVDFFQKGSVIIGVALMFDVVVWGILEIIKMGGIQ